MSRSLFVLTVFVCSLRAQGTLTLHGQISNLRGYSTIDLVDSQKHFTVARTIPQPDGRFSIAPIEPGSYEVRVLGEGGQLLRAVPVTVSFNTMPVEIQLPEFPEPQRPVSGIVSVKDLTKTRRHAIDLVARGHLEKAVETDPSYAVPHHEIGVRYLRAGLPGDARRELLKAIELDPGLTIAYTNLAVADLKLGLPRNAEVCARTAVEMDPQNPKARYVYQFALWRNGKAPRPDPNW